MAADIPVADAAASLGLRVHRDGTIGPCPGCGAAARGRDDRRGPIGVGERGLGWRCHRCGARGDAIDLAAAVELGVTHTEGQRRPSWGPENHARVMARLGAERPPTAPQAPAEPVRTYPPMEEVARLWASCLPVRDCPELRQWWEARGWAWEAVPGPDVVRAMPRDGWRPSWWPSTWVDHRVVVPAYDCRGVIRSVHARAVGGDGPKTRWPRGHLSARLMFRWGLERPGPVVIGEGLTGFLRAVMLGHPVICCTSGGFEGLAGLENPPDSYIIATDNDDGNRHRPGERYAEAIRAALPRSRCLRRIRWPEGMDLGNCPKLPGEAVEATKQKIVVSADMPAVADAAMASLQQVPGLYSRASSLVIVDAEGTIQRVGAHWTRLALARAADWVQVRKEEEVPAMVPDWVAPAILAQPSWPVPGLRAVSEIPVLRPDGSIHDVPGYDEATQTVFRGLRCEIQDDPAVATQQLVDLFADFPVVSEADRGVVLAAILTMVGRSAIDGPCPMFAFTADTRGSGKTLLVDAISMVARGTLAARQIYTDNDEEFRKRVTSVLRSGRPMALLDNLDIPVGGAVLDAVLTSTTWEDRLLGETGLVTVPAYTVWFATGNNLQLKGDLSRRVLMCRLSPGVERPEERTEYAHPKLLAYIAANRGRYVGAALGLLRAWIRARPTAGTPPGMGSYEAWNDLVRGCLWWRGYRDGADLGAGTRDTLAQGGDPDLAALSQLLEEWPTGQVQVAEVIRVAQAEEGAYIAGQRGAPSGLQAAIVEVAAGSSGRVDPRRLGRFLARVRGRVVAGRRFASEAGRTGALKWRVECL